MDTDSFTLRTETLYKLTHVGPDGITIEYFYLDRPQDLAHIQILARTNRDLTTSPHFSGSVLTMRCQAQIDGYTQSPVANIIHPCSWQDLRNIQNTWDSPCRFEDWLKEVLGLPDMHEQIKQRLRRPVNT